MHRGQLRFAERFTRRYGGELLCAHGFGWLYWDGTRWAECDDHAQARAVHALIKEALRELPDHHSTDRDNLYRDTRKIESAGGVAGVLALAKTMHPCTLAAAKLDADGYRLNTASGTVTLETGTLTTPRPRDHITKVTRAAFDPTARSAAFEKFLERIQPDPLARAFLARQLGSALLGVVREHVLFIWTGTGANGKGTLRDAVLHALGDYAVEVPPELLLLSTFASNSKADADRIALKGSRVAFCSEIARGARMDEPIMKRLTGGDPVTAKLLYENPVTFAPSHTLFMLTNHLPQVRGDDPAIWRRLVAVPFPVVIPEDERDARLPEQLKEEPDAVLAWLWAGWLDYQARGLDPPAEVLAATQTYQHDSDVLARFLADEEAILLDHGNTQSSKLFEHFNAWAHTQGERPKLTQKAFTQGVQRLGFERYTGNGGRVQWRGISIVTDIEERPDQGW